MSRNTKGQIIGGNIQAEIRVVSSIIGSQNEKRTIISVKGFSRNAIKTRLEELISEIENLKNEMAKLKQEISTYANITHSTEIEMKKYIRLQDEFFKIKDKIKDLESDKKNLASALRTRGEGEITVTKKVYPGVVFEIKNLVKEINIVMLNSSFFIQDGEIKQI